MLPRRLLSPRETFQARFLGGANLLALLVALASMMGEAIEHRWLSMTFIAAFAAASVAQLAALRLGVRLAILVWTALGLLAAFLTFQSLVTAELQPSQPHWLLLLPIASMVLVDPRSVRASHLPPMSMPLLVSVAALALGLFIVAAHRLGWTFGERLSEPSVISAVVEQVTFFVSTGGLLLVYDRTARKALAELATLRKLLAMCAWCRRIRDDKNDWVQVEQYVTTHVSPLTHGICPDCARRHFGDLDNEVA